jgi:hypothetical protein
MLDLSKKKQEPPCRLIKRMTMGLQQTVASHIIDPIHGSGDDRRRTCPPHTADQYVRTRTQHDSIGSITRARADLDVCQDPASCWMRLSPAPQRKDQSASQRSSRPAERKSRDQSLISDIKKNKLI